MNELLRNVLTRRSIHKFAARQIDDRDLAEIVEAGRFVSGALKNQAWHFTVVQNSGLLAELDGRIQRALAEYGKEFFRDGANEETLKILVNAPTLLLISGSNDEAETLDAANALFGNMMLAAERNGLGACWLYSVRLLFASADGRDLIAKLGIPEGYSPLCAGVFGYKAAAMPPLFLAENGVNIIR